MTSKEDRRQVRALVESLEARCASGNLPTEDEIHDLVCVMEKLGFPEDSSYFARIEFILDKVENPDAVTPANPCAPAVAHCTPAPQLINPSEPNSPILKPQNGRVDYYGNLHDHTVRVTPRYDHVFLAMYYTGFNDRYSTTFKITHRFNGKGRVDIVDIQLVKSFEPSLDRAVRHLVTVEGYERRAKAWTSGFMKKIIYDWTREQSMSMC
jgi:hypothetical protein